MSKDRKASRLSSLFSSSQTNLHAPQSRSTTAPNNSTNLLPNTQPQQANKLSKSGTSHERVPSGQMVSPAPLLPPAQIPQTSTLRKPVPRPNTDNLLSPLQMPPAIGANGRIATSPVSSRPSSMAGSRPTTPLSQHSAGSAAPLTPTSAKKVTKKRSSWLLGGGGNAQQAHPTNKKGANGPKAWILGQQGSIYDLNILLDAHKVRRRQL